MAKTKPAASTSEGPLGCDTCPFWKELGVYQGERMGSCKRWPPTLDTSHLTASGPVGRFPITLAGELCGEHPSHPSRPLPSSFPPPAISARPPLR